MPSLLQEKEQEKQQEKEKEVEVHVGREREREAGLGFPAWRSQIPIPVQTAALKLLQGRLIRSLLWPVCSPSQLHSEPQLFNQFHFVVLWETCCEVEWPLKVLTEAELPEQARG